jgi:hypothetical protein
MTEAYSDVPDLPSSCFSSYTAPVLNSGKIQDPCLCCCARETCEDVQCDLPLLAGVCYRLRPRLRCRGLQPSGRRTSRHRGLCSTYCRQVSNGRANRCRPLSKFHTRGGRVSQRLTGILKPTEKLWFVVIGSLAALNNPNV